MAIANHLIRDTENEKKLFDGKRKLIACQDENGKFVYQHVITIEGGAVYMSPCETCCNAMRSFVLSEYAEILKERPVTP